MFLEPHRWAVVSTIKAPTKDILSFAAHYLSLGATHLYLFLDFPDPEAQEHLEKHAHIRVTNTAPDYWQARGRRRQINMRAYPKFGAMVSGGGPQPSSWKILFPHRARTYGAAHSFL